MFNKTDNENPSLFSKEQKERAPSRANIANRRETPCGVISLADQKREKQRALLMEKLLRDGFLE